MTWTTESVFVGEWPLRGVASATINDRWVITAQRTSPGGSGGTMVAILDTHSITPFGNDSISVHTLLPRWRTNVSADSSLGKFWVTGAPDPPDTTVELHAVAPDGTTDTYSGMFWAPAVAGNPVLVATDEWIAIGRTGSPAIDIFYPQFELAWTPYAPANPVIAIGKHGNRLFAATGNTDHNGHNLFEIDPMAGVTLNAWTSPTEIDNATRGIPSGNRIYWPTTNSDSLVWIDVTTGAIGTLPTPPVPNYGPPSGLSGLGEWMPHPNGKIYRLSPNYATGTSHGMIQLDPATGNQVGHDLGTVPFADINSMTMTNDAVWIPRSTTWLKVTGLGHPGPVSSPGWVRGNAWG